MPSYAAHYTEEFFPNPTEFQPERFLKENSANIIPYTYRPFGGGPRICLGQRFALTEMSVFMAKLLKKFKFVAVPETRTEYVPGNFFFRQDSCEPKVS